MNLLYIKKNGKRKYCDFFSFLLLFFIGKKFKCENNNDKKGKACKIECKRNKKRWKKRKENGDKKQFFQLNFQCVDLILLNIEIFYNLLSFFCSYF